MNTYQCSFLNQDHSIFQSELSEKELHYSLDVDIEQDSTILKINWIAQDMYLTDSTKVQFIPKDKGVASISIFASPSPTEPMDCSHRVARFDITVTN